MNSNVPKKNMSISDPLVRKIKQQMEEQDAADPVDK